MEKKEVRWWGGVPRILILLIQIIILCNNIITHIIISELEVSVVLLETRKQ